MKNVILLLVVFVAISFNVLWSSSTDIEKIDNLSLKELMNIKISTASKFDESIKDIPASIVIITRKDIQKYGYKSLADILSNIPGFYMINDYYWLGSENFGIRGFFSAGVLNDIVILVNGVNRVGGTYSDYSLTKNDIPVEAIDRIEVIRGPMSIMYGSGAFMGAINIITNRSVKNYFSISLGSQNYKKIFLRLSNKGKDFGYSLNISNYGDDGIKGKFTNFTNNTKFLKDVGLSDDAVYDGMLNFTKKNINFSAIYKELSVEFNYYATEKGIFDGIPSYYPGTLFHDESFSLRLKYERQINKSFSLTGKLTFFSDSFYWEYSIFNLNSYATNYNRDASREIELNLFYNFCEQSNLIVGFVRHMINYFYKTYDYPLYHTRYTNTEMLAPDDIISDALFGQLNYWFNEKLKIIAGLRIEKLHKYSVKIRSAMDTPLEKITQEKYADDNYKFIPRFAVIFSPSDLHTIKLMYGKAIKQPSLMQNIFQIHAGYPSLYPAFIETFELNYIFSPASNFITNISLYKNNLDDLIVKKNIYNPDTKAWELYSTNGGRMQTTGVEFCIKILPINNMNINLDLTYQNTKNLEEDLKNITPGYAPKFLGNLKLSYSINKCSFAIMGKYVGKMETLWDNTLIPGHSGKVKGRIGNPINSQYKFDFNFRANDILGRNFFINLHIYNLFNNEIRYPVTPGNSWAELGTLDYGRTIIIGIGKKFK